MRELKEEEIAEVSGGISKDAGYAVSLGSAGMFLGLAVGAAALTPLGVV